MKAKFYTVFDSKVGVYHRPFLLRSRGEALRSWIDIVNDRTTEFNKHPEDYTLFEIGEYDEDQGDLLKYDVKVSVAAATDVHKGYGQDVGQPS